MKTAACIALLALAASACSKNDNTQTPDDMTTTPGTETATSTTAPTQMPAVETAAPNEITTPSDGTASRDAFGAPTGGSSGNGATGNAPGATGNGGGAGPNGATGDTTKTANGASASGATGVPGAAGAPSRPDADNTRVNERDRSAATTTPMDQGNNDTDLKITQKIRQAVMNDGVLSFTAKNVKIITNKGTVVLRGPVKNDDERARIDSAAKTVAGATNVINEIEIKK